MEKRSGRRERKREETRRSIAGAAMTLFLERGFDAVTIAEVAEASDVSVNTVFNYFPTKEDLFFGAHETGESAMERVAGDRRPGEPVVAFLRRHLEEGIERFVQGAGNRGDHEYWMGVRRVLQESPALQVRAAHAARGSARAAEDALAASLARDAGKRLDDPRARLIAGLILALYSAVFAEAERRRRAGATPRAIRACLKTAADAALDVLERGVGDYGTAGPGTGKPM